MNSLIINKLSKQYSLKTTFKVSLKFHRNNYQKYSWLYIRHKRYILRISILF